MRRRTAAIASVAVLGLLAGPAAAAFVATTSNGGNSFSTRAITSVPTISDVRITTKSDCSAATPASTIVQGEAFFVCVQSVSDTSGVSSVTTDVSSINGDDAAPLATSGGPWSGYAWRTASLTAGVPLTTGSTGSYSVRATNTDGNAKTASGQLYNVRSYFGRLTGEFGAAGLSGLQQYYRLSEVSGTSTNYGSGNYPATYHGSPTRGVPGALVGSADTAVHLSGGSDYLSATRRVWADFSLALWVRGDANSGAGPGTVWNDSAGLMMMAADSSAASPDLDAGLGLDATGRLVAGCGASQPANGPVTIRSAAGILNDGEWHFVVFIRAATSQVIGLYVDGALVDVSTECSTDYYTQQPELWIGRGQESLLSVDADIDEPATFGRALNGTEISELYRLGTGT